MAVCDNHPELDAGLIIGNTATGEQLFLCGSCAARFGLDMALEILPGDEIRAALGLAPDVAAVAEAPNGGSRRSRKRKPAPEPEPEPAAVAAPGPDEVPPALEDGGDTGV